MTTISVIGRWSVVPEKHMATFGAPCIICRKTNWLRFDGHMAVVGSKTCKHFAGHRAVKGEGVYLSFTQQTK